MNESLFQLERGWEGEERFPGELVPHELRTENTRLTFAETVSPSLLDGNQLLVNSVELVISTEGSMKEVIIALLRHSMM